LAALEADPPAAILLTNDQWPKGQGFEAADNWPEFMALLTSHYDLNLTGHEDYIVWRFYLRRAPASNAPAVKREPEEDWGKRGRRRPRLGLTSPPLCRSSQA